MLVFPIAKKVIVNLLQTIFNSYSPRPRYKKALKSRVPYWFLFFFDQFGQPAPGFGLAHCCPIKLKEKGRNPHVVYYNDFT